MSTDYKVLVLATSPRTKGGVTAVISAYRNTALWADWHCFWLSTHIDKAWYVKIGFFIKSYFTFLFILHRFDLIHIHLSEPASLIRKSLFFITARLFRKKLVVHFHSFANDKTTHGSLSWLYRYVFNRTDLILVLSESTKNALSNFVDRDVKIEILYNPAVTLKSKILLHSGVFMPYILFAGSMVPTKGYIDLVHTFIEIAADYPEWRLILAGGIPDQAVLDEIDRNGLKERISFPGWVSGTAKATLFEEATIFCLPSYQEGLPMAILDAMVAGVPVVTNPVGSLPDFFKNKQHLLYALPGDNSLLKKQLLQLMNSTDLRKKISQTAIEFVLQEFDIKKLHLRLVHFYKTILAI